MRRLAAAVAVSFAVAAPTAIAAERAPGEIVVSYERGVIGAERAAVRRSARVDLVRQLRVPRAELVRTTAGADVEALARQMSRRPGVAFAEPNFVFRTAAAPNDPLFGRLWGLNASGGLVDGLTTSAEADIDAPEA